MSWIARHVLVVVRRAVQDRREIPASAAPASVYRCALAELWRQTSPEMRRRVQEESVCWTNTLNNLMATFRETKRSLETEGL